MSNLGAYQTFTTVAKKVGGPKNLLLLTSISSAVAYKIGEIVVKKSITTVKKYSLKKREDTKKYNKLYSVTVSAKSNEGLVFNVGDQFRVLENDGDAVLIEKVEDVGNPYFVSAEFLKLISNY